MKVKLNIDRPIRTQGKYEFNNLEDFYKFLINEKIRGINPNKFLYALVKGGSVNILTYGKDIEAKFDKPSYEKATNASKKTKFPKPSSSVLQFIRIFEGKN